MPTTRKRWHADTKRTDANINMQASPVENAAEDSPNPTPGSEETVEGDVVDHSGEGDATAPSRATRSAATDTAIEHQKRSVGHDEINPRSPKRPRMSPIDDEDLMEQKQDPGVPPAVVPPPSHSVSTPATVSQSMPQLEHGLPAKVASPDQDSLMSRTSTPSPQTRLDNLPILSNLAGQLLSVLAKMSANETLHLAANLANNVLTQNYQEYRTIRTLLDPVWKLYRTGHAFLIPHQLGLTSASQSEILHKANQAVWLTSIFTGEVGLRDMNQAFLFNFVPEGGKLLKSQGAIFLELKTQAFITAHRVRAADPRIVLADLFPSDMDQQLLSRRPGTRSLAPSEQDFLKRLSSRRDILAEDIKANRLEELQVRYGWDQFNKEIYNYVSKNFGTAISSSSSVAPPSASYAFATPVQDLMQREFSVHDPPMQMSGSPRPTIIEYPQRPLHTYPRLIPNNKDDWMAQLARASEIALQDFTPTSEATPPLAAPQTPTVPQDAQSKTATPTPRVQPHFQHYNPASATASTKNSSPAPENAEIPHASQSAPTQVLYERARQAATAKANTKTVPKPDTPSQRRPWTQEEESALMTGLDQVKGPHWSQILAMYGRGGSINESLKDRNQVQLKDKARNLKLFFLKNGTEVPYYLTEVTGDLKTRAPGQAEKQERERLQVEENKAHYDGLQGIMALSNGTSYEGDDVEETYDDGDVEAMEDAEELIHATFPPTQADPMTAETMITRASEKAKQEAPPG